MPLGAGASANDRGSTSVRGVGGAATLGVAVSAAVDGAGAAGGGSCTRRPLSLA